MGVGREHRGLYFLKDQPLNVVDTRIESIVKNLLESQKENLLVAGIADGSKVLKPYEVWHKRLGQAPLNKLKQLPNVQLEVIENKVCHMPNGKAHKTTFLAQHKQEYKSV